MNELVVIRAPAPLAERLLAEQLASRMPSETRSGPLEVVVHASLVVKDVASVVLAVAAGARGVGAILERLRRETPDLDVVVTVHSADVDRAWSLKPGQLDDTTIDEITGAVRAAAASEQPSNDLPA